MKVSMKKLAVALAFAATLAVGPVANATTLTFDSIPLNPYLNTSIPNGYGGLNWLYFGVLDGLTYTFPPNSGYKNAVVSGSNVAFGGGITGFFPATISSSNGFILNDAYFTSAWNNGNVVTVDATDGVNKYTKIFTINKTGPVDEVFDWSNIKSVTFTTSLNQFAMDNLTINAPVPEPESYAMMLAGLGLMGFMVRRKKSPSAFK